MKPSLAMPGLRTIEVIVLNDEEAIKIPLDEKEQTTEDVLFFIAHKLGIGPLCRHLFGLQVLDTGDWIHPNCVLQTTPYNVLVYRLRFKVPILQRLRDLDKNAYDYLYYQMRKDILNCNVNGLSYEKYKSEILGLSVADMYRVMLERKKTLEQMESEYKKFIPKVILKGHGFFIKQKIIEAMKKLISGKHEVMFVKDECLKEFVNIAPDYLFEEFSAQVDENGELRTVTILCNPFHPETAGIMFRYSEREEWQHLCRIEELCSISLRTDGTVQIHRKTGVPIYYKFATLSIVYSLVTLLDGYYRLTTKWTFNLCNDVFSPSMKKLLSLKCHGPVGGLFSYAKLQEKRENKAGTFILRECENNDSVYYLDVCLKDLPKPKTFRIDKNPTGDFTFSYDGKTYSSLTNLIMVHRTKSENGLELIECLPPSEFDKSQLLICAAESWACELTAVTDPQEFLLKAEPQCISVQSLQVFPSSRKEGRSGKTIHYRAMWKYSQRSRVQVDIKELRPELKEKLCSEFLELSGRWACLRSKMIVKLYGVTLTSRVSMVTEHMELGPLDEFLQQNQTSVQTVDLVEAGCSLAMAMWHLEEAGMTHGYIRCRKLLVAAHDSHTLKVKLCDPGMHKLTDEDLPWIPPECFSNYSKAKAYSSADVWAFGTTLWEIFSYGKLPIAMDKADYLAGFRLPQPRDCHLDIYRLMLECWDIDVYKRKGPQAVMRDLYHILYRVFNARRVHSYESTYPRTFPAEDRRCLDESAGSFGGSLRSTATTETELQSLNATERELVSVDPVMDDPDLSISSSGNLGQLIIFRENGPYSTQANPDLTNFPLRRRGNRFTAETVLQLGAGCNIILQGAIGEGYYGQVFKGLLEREGRPEQNVAVKRLKSGAMSSKEDDLMREISIMQDLDHRNIVRIIGVVKDMEEKCLVMEFVSHGSLLYYLTYKINLTVRSPALFKFSEDIACGMDYLGRRNIVHRDLAARNILVASDNLVKISDFGLAQQVGAAENDYYTLKTCRDLPIKWYAPESLDKGQFSCRSDVWSYGVTLYEMFSFGGEPNLEGLPAEIDITTQLDALGKGQRLPCPPGDGMETIYKSLLLPCWNYNSRKRPSFSNLIDIVRQLQVEIASG